MGSLEVAEMKEQVRQVLLEKLHGTRFVNDKAAATCREIVDAVKAKMLAVDSTNYKYIVETQLFEKRGGGFRCAFYLFSRHLLLTFFLCELAPTASATGMPSGIGMSRRCTKMCVLPFLACAMLTPAFLGLADVRNSGLCHCHLEHISLLFAMFSCL